MYPDSTPEKQSGLGLIAALFLIVVVALLVAGILSLVRTSSLSFAQDVLAHKALMSAESGAQLSLNRLYQPFSGAAGTCSAKNWSFTQPGLENCVATVTCVADVVAAETYFTLDSHGRCDNGSGIAERRVLVRSKP